MVGCFLLIIKMCFLFPKLIINNYVDITLETW